MFALVVRYLYFLKHVPLAPQLFDVLIRMYYTAFKGDVIRYIDEIERELMRWDSVCVKMHRYGGIEFVYRDRELGHIHSNGLLDILFTRKQKNDLIANKRADHHHKFPNSGWVSL